MSFLSVLYNCCKTPCNPGATAQQSTLLRNILLFSRPAHIIHLHSIQERGKVNPAAVPSKVSPMKVIQFPRAMREDDNDHGRAERSQLDGQGNINPQPSSEGTSAGPGKQRSGPPVQPQSQEAADVQRSLAPQPASSRAPPRRVDHTYRDYSSYPLSELPSGKKSPSNFPSKLHQILAAHEYSHVSLFCT